MMGTGPFEKLAVIAGAGALPGLLLKARPDALLVRVSGVPVEVQSGSTLAARFERLGALFDDLHVAGVTEIVFAGAMNRPALDPAEFDEVTLGLAPRIMAALGGGDDGLLRMIIGIFEDQGFRVVGAHDVIPDLTVPAEKLTDTNPAKRDQEDALRGWQILEALGPQDVAQACVVAGGVCFGIETIQGTDKLLQFVADTRAGLRPGSGGVLVKRAKPGQDLRIDMPTIGPATVAGAASAGLSGICIEAGSVLVPDRDEVIARADAARIALWAIAGQEP